MPPTYQRVRAWWPVSSAHTADSPISRLLQSLTDVQCSRCQLVKSDGVAKTKSPEPAQSKMLLQHAMAGGRHHIDGVFIIGMLDCSLVRGEHLVVFELVWRAEATSNTPDCYQVAVYC